MGEILHTGEQPNDFEKALDELKSMPEGRTCIGVFNRMIGFFRVAAEMNTNVTREEIVQVHKELIGVVGTNEIIDILQQKGLIQIQGNVIKPASGVQDWYKNRKD